MAFKIAYTAGHGYKTAGKRTPDGEREWSFNNQVVNAFERELKKHDVELLRLDDSTGKTDIPLSTRTKKANQWGADVYVSFHHNANTGKWGSWGGTETYYYVGSNNGKQLAQLVHDATVKAYNLRDRGIKKGNHLWEIRKAIAPSALIEGGFMDSTTDINKLRDKEVLAQAGINVAYAVLEYANIKTETPKEKEAPKKKVKSKKVNGKIAYIQKMLNDRYAFNIAVDNITGPQTKKALIKGYQTELNKQFKRELAVDGIWGKRTKGASVTVRKGASGNLTWILQATLVIHGFDLGVDGMFGTKTQNAVKGFQAKEHLTVDGLVGKNTWEKLLK